MRRYFWAALLLAAIPLLSISATADDCVTGLSGSETTARAVALQFLILLDQGKFGEAWDGASPRMKSQGSRDQYIATMAGRTALGNASERVLKSVHSTTTFPGLPDGQYVALRFEAKFSNADRYPYMMEGVLLELGRDQQWRVIHMFGS